MSFGWFQWVTCETCGSTSCFAQISESLLKNEQASDKFGKRVDEPKSSIKRNPHELISIELITDPDSERRRGS